MVFLERRQRPSSELSQSELHVPPTTTFFLSVSCIRACAESCAEISLTQGGFHSIKELRTCSINLSEIWEVSKKLWVTILYVTQLHYLFSIFILYYITIMLLVKFRLLRGCVMCCFTLFLFAGDDLAWHVQTMIQPRLKNHPDRFCFRILNWGKFWFVSISICMYLYCTGPYCSLLYCMLAACYVKFTSWLLFIEVIG